MSLLWRRGEVEVRWLGGGLFVAWREAGLLLDAPPGVVDAAAAAGLLPRVRAIALSGGRLRSTGGLVALLCGLEAHRDARTPLPVHVPLGDERGARLVDAWIGGWGQRFPVWLDTAAPDVEFTVGRLRVEAPAVPRAEARWLPAPAVESVPGLGFRVHTPEGVIAFLPGAAPSDRARRVALGARLAVVEVGVVPWPEAPGRFRFDRSGAAQAGASAETCWLVGDDGAPLPMLEAD